MKEIVIVVDTSNYKASYSEPIPFKASVVHKDEGEITITVQSLDTGKEYELYFDQLLEYLDADEIKKLIDLSKY